MRIALAQIETVLGAVDVNLAHHLNIVRQAVDGGCDLVVFPELSLTGYALNDLVTEVAIPVNPEGAVFCDLLPLSRDVDIVFSFVEEDARHLFYISAAYLSEGAIIHVHRKCYLPTYGLFDEGRFFAQGNDIKAFDTRFGRVGMLICEDYWHVSVPYLLWLDGADLILMMSAHPARGFDGGDKPSSVRWIETVSRAYAGVFTTLVAHSLRAGGEDGFTFWGGSAVFDPNGESVAQAESTGECLVVADISLADIRHTRARLPLLRDERPNLTLRTLRRILKENE